MSQQSSSYQEEDQENFYNEVSEEPYYEDNQDSLFKREINVLDKFNTYNAYNNIQDKKTKPKTAFWKSKNYQELEVNEKTNTNFDYYHNNTKAASAYNRYKEDTCNNESINSLVINMKNLINDSKFLEAFKNLETSLNTSIMKKRFFFPINIYLLKLSLIETIKTNNESEFFRVLQLLYPLMSTRNLGYHKYETLKKMYHFSFMFSSLYYTTTLLYYCKQSLCLLLDFEKKLQENNTKAIDKDYYDFNYDIKTSLPKNEEEKLLAKNNFYLANLEVELAYILLKFFDSKTCKNNFTQFIKKEYPEINFYEVVDPKNYKNIIKEFNGINTIDIHPITQKATKCVIRETKRIGDKEKDDSFKKKDQNSKSEKQNSSENNVSNNNNNIINNNTMNNNLSVNIDNNNTNNNNYSNDNDNLQITSYINSTNNNNNSYFNDLCDRNNLNIMNNNLTNLNNSNRKEDKEVTNKKLKVKKFPDIKFINYSKNTFNSDYYHESEIENLKSNNINQVLNTNNIDKFDSKNNNFNTDYYNSDANYYNRNHKSSLNLNLNINFNFNINKRGSKNNINNNNIESHLFNINNNNLYSEVETDTNDKYNIKKDLWMTNSNQYDKENNNLDYYSSLYKNNNMKLEDDYLGGETDYFDNGNNGNNGNNRMMYPDSNNLISNNNSLPEFNHSTNPNFCINNTNNSNNTLSLKENSNEDLPKQPLTKREFHEIFTISKVAHSNYQNKNNYTINNLLKKKEKFSYYYDSDHFNKCQINIQQQQEAFINSLNQENENNIHNQNDINNANNTNHDHIDNNNNTNNAHDTIMNDLNGINNMNNSNINDFSFVNNTNINNKENSDSLLYTINNGNNDINDLNNLNNLNTLNTANNIIQGINTNSILDSNYDNNITNKVVEELYQDTKNIINKDNNDAMNNFNCNNINDNYIYSSIHSNTPIISHIQTNLNNASVSENPFFPEKDSSKDSFFNQTLNTDFLGHKRQNDMQEFNSNNANLIAPLINYKETDSLINTIPLMNSKSTLFNCSPLETKLSSMNTPFLQIEDLKDERKKPCLFKVINANLNNNPENEELNKHFSNINNTSFGSKLDDNSIPNFNNIKNLNNLSNLSIPDDYNNSNCVLINNINDNLISLDNNNNTQLSNLISTNNINNTESLNNFPNKSIQKSNSFDNKNKNSAVNINPNNRELDTQKTNYPTDNQSSISNTMAISSVGNNTEDKDKKTHVTNINITNSNNNSSNNILKVNKNFKLSLLKHFNFQILKRENIDKKVLRKFRGYLHTRLSKNNPKQKIKPEQCQDSFICQFLKKRVYPPFTSLDDRVFKSFSTSYMIWFFSHPQIINYYNEFIHYNLENLTDYLSKTFDLKSDEEIKTLKNYINQITNIYGDFNYKPNLEEGGNAEVTANNSCNINSIDIDNSTMLNANMTFKNESLNNNNHIEIIKTNSGSNFNANNTVVKEEFNNLMNLERNNNNFDINNEINRNNSFPEPYPVSLNINHNSSLDYTNHHNNDSSNTKNLSNISLNHMNYLSSLNNISNNELTSIPEVYDNFSQQNMNNIDMNTLNSNLDFFNQNQSQDK